MGGTTAQFVKYKSQVPAGGQSRFATVGSYLGELEVSVITFQRSSTNFWATYCVLVVPLKFLKYMPVKLAALGFAVHSAAVEP